MGLAAARGWGWGLCGIERRGPWGWWGFRGRRGEAAVPGASAQGAPCDGAAPGPAEGEGAEGGEGEGAEGAGSSWVSPGGMGRREREVDGCGEVGV